MSTIQIKRGLASKLASLSLQAGEPAFTTDTGKLFIGDGTKNIEINPLNKPDGLDITKEYTKVRVNEFGQVITLGNLSPVDLPNAIPVEKITGLGTAAIKNSGTGAGELPILDVNGKLDTTVLPSIAITDTYTVTSQVAMLELDAQKGDVCVRTDLRKTYILKDTPATLLENWVELETPTDSVQSVNSKTGTVVLNSGDILLTDYSKPFTGGNILETDNLSQAVGKIEKNLDSYAPIASPSLTGVPNAPTAIAGTSTTQIATTAFIDTAVTNLKIEEYAKIASPTFTGVPNAPTATVGTNTTQVATTAFLFNSLALIDGGTF